MKISRLLCSGGSLWTVLHGVYSEAHYGWEARGSPTICTVSVMHILQAITILLWPNGAGATATLALLGGLHTIDTPDDTNMMCALMLFTAALALIAALFRVGQARLIMLLPQHIILGVMGLGGMAAVVLGHYLDGVVVPRAHIYVDQVVVSSFWFAHMFSISRRARDT